MGRKNFKGTKTLFDDDNYKQDLIFCELSGLPYIVTESNYTLKIESSFLNKYFVQNMRSNFAFAVGKMIVNDIKKTGLTAPCINKNDLRYFDFNIPDKLKKGLAIPKIYNIDIKHAYANVLRNHALVSDRTFKYMESLEKPDRLAAVGMLASQKEIFEIVGREVISNYSETNENKDWFYFCVTRTNEIMYKCREILGNTFLHFWVDGIFTDSIRHAEKIGRYLSAIGYEYSFDECTDYTYFEDSSGERVEYYKDNEKKSLFLPKKNNEAAKFLIHFLSLHDETVN